MKLFEKENYKDAETVKDYYNNTSTASAIKNILIRMKDHEVKFLISPKCSVDKIRDSQGAIRILDKLLHLEESATEFLVHYKK